ncbi:MAG: Dimethylamine corrinoid protein [Promethearchaeota archaeon]|nr:MAG: Dimethylamine corrinoid protein [Candidatus Lokiarchaeota archaeon]
MSEELINALVELDDKKVIQMVEKQLKNRDPIEIFNDLKLALTKVGDLFEKKEYFLSDLIIAADIFKEANVFIEPHFEPSIEEIKGKIVIGTVAGDMHDIGKNIMITLLKSEGYEVIDLGIDVKTERFLEAVKEYKPNILGLSGLLTTSKGPMKKTIELVKRNYNDTLIIIVGGVPITEDWVKDVDADYGTINAVTGLKIINEVLN